MISLKILETKPNSLDQIYWLEDNSQQQRGDETSQKGKFDTISKQDVFCHKRDDASQHASFSCQF